MSDTGTQPAPVATGQKPAPSADVSWKLVLLVAIVMGGIIAVALPIVFHYPMASGATSVLGVVLPIFTAVMGAALGAGVGNATGSAGKKASDQKAAQSRQSLLAVKEALQRGKPKVDGVFDTVKSSLLSPAGQANFMATPARDAPVEIPTIDIAHMDTASAALERIQAIVDTALSTE